MKFLYMYFIVNLILSAVFCLIVRKITKRNKTGIKSSLYYYLLITTAPLLKALDWATYIVRVVAIKYTHTRIAFSSKSKHESIIRKVTNRKWLKHRMIAVSILILTIVFIPLCIVTLFIKTREYRMLKSDVMARLKKEMTV
jgi:hypothetical protein